MLTLATPTGIEGSTALAALLARADTRPSDDFFARDWTELWRTLEEDGWVDALEPDGARPDGAVGLDVAAYAEQWGRRLIPLPFTERLALSAIGSPAGGLALVFPDGARRTPHPALFGMSADAVVDDWALSRPVARDPRPDASASPAAEGLTSLLIVGWAGEAVGAAQECLRLGVEYAGVRSAYGHRIGHFQAVKHLLADAHVDIELARSGLAWLVSDPSTASPVGEDVVRRCQSAITRVIQVFAGMGFTWEGGLHFYLRHAVGARKLIRAVGHGSHVETWGSR